MTNTITRDPWLTLREAPLAAAAAVSLADPGGAGRETEALVRAWRGSAETFRHSAVVQRLVAEFDPEEPPEPSAARRTPPTPEAVLDEAVALCREAAEVLAQTVSEREADAYKDFVLHIARAVAEASRSGGALGIGGVPVTIEEQAALRAIRVALGYTPPELRL